MTITLFIVGWFACGLLGGFLIYLDHQWELRLVVAPRPLDVLLWIIQSPLGPIMLGMGLFNLVAGWFGRQDRKSSEESWWARPISQPKDFFKDAWWKKK